MAKQTVLSVMEMDSVFPLSTDTLAKLVDPKNPDLLNELGGLDGIAKALHSDVKRGLSPPRVPEGGDITSGNEVDDRRVAKYAKKCVTPTTTRNPLRYDIRSFTR